MVVLWIVLGMFAGAIVFGVALLCREFHIAPYCCERCERPTELAELEAGAGYCERCRALA